MKDLKDTKLGKIALVEYKYSKVILIGILILTIFFGIQALSLSFESDIMKGLPQDFDVVRTQQLITSEFGAEEAIVILLETNLDEISDIRNKKTLESIYSLEERLKSRPEILDAIGPGNVYYSIFGGIPDNQNILNEVAESMPQLISSDYSAALVLVRTASFAYDSESIDSIVKVVEEEIKKENLYGLNYNLTGTPILVITMLELLQEDIVMTIVIALLIIFILLSIIFRLKSFFIIAPPILGLIWTAGQLSLMGVPITVATGTFGAIIVGLGTVYGIFMVSRYREEAMKGASNEERVVAMIAGIGKGTIGSSSTTAVGFLALTLSSMPSVVELGQTLSLGIINCVIAAFFFLPSLMALKEWDVGGLHLTSDRVNKKIVRFTELQVKRPKSFLLVGIFVTLLIGSGIGYLNVIEETEESMLPEDSEIMMIYSTFKDKFHMHDSMLVLVRSENVLSPAVLSEIYLLNNQLTNIYGIEGSSFNLNIEDIYLPKVDLKRRLQVSDSLEYIIINLDVAEGIDELQVYDDIQNVLAETPVSAQMAGTMVLIREITDIIMPEMSKISTLGLVGIFLCVILTFKSIRFGIIPLLSVGVGVVWMMGIAGFLGTAIDSGLVGIVTMMAGIGIDFAIQTINRFKFERSPILIEKVSNTFQGVFEPILLSTVVIGFGFMATFAANLSFMEVLGQLLIIGVFSCMAVTLIFLPSFLVIQEKIFEDTKKLIEKKMEVYYEKE